MGSLSDIQENTIEKEKEGLYVEVLTPWETKIKEELCQSFIVYRVCNRHLLNWLIVMVLVKLFPFDVYLPVLKCWLFGLRKIKVKYKGFLNADVEVNVLFLR